MALYGESQSLPCYSTQAPEQHQPIPKRPVSTRPPIFQAGSAVSSPHDGLCPSDGIAAIEGTWRSRHAAACTSRGSKTRRSPTRFMTRCGGTDLDGEMPTLDADTVPSVDRGQHDDRRRSETLETHVVGLRTSDVWQRLGAPVCARTRAQPLIENRPATHYERHVSWPHAL
jgi:hypothetical protein